MTVDARPSSAPVSESGSRPDGSVTPTPPAPTMHDLWLAAGGGTDGYNPDAYLVALRENGFAKQRKGLGAVCFDVIGWATAEAGIPGFDDATTDDLAGPLARHLVDELHRQGYAIHDLARCVRVPGDPLTIGRPMTPEEEVALVIPHGPTSGDARPRTSATNFEHVTPEGDRFLVPDDWTPGEKSSRCRSCNALILWTTTHNNRRNPLNPDGTSHFSDCPDAATWRKERGS